MATSFAGSPLNRVVPSSPRGMLCSPLATNSVGSNGVNGGSGASNNINSNNNNNSSSSSSSAPTLLTCTPSSPTVDYDTNVTPLYEHIGESDWDAAERRCRTHPHEAGTWVVRYRRRDDDTKTGNDDPVVNPRGEREVLWRFLPIHSACALNPPTSFLRALSEALPDGSRTLDDQGMLPLHYACGARCGREVLYHLLMSFPQAALGEDPNGMLPLHYLARWGPSEPGVMDMVCVATGHKVGTALDGDGNTAEMLAAGAEYEGSEGVARKIREFASRHDDGGPATTTPQLRRSSSSGGGNAGMMGSGGNPPSFRQRGGGRLSVKTAALGTTTAVPRATIPHCAARETPRSTPHREQTRDRYQSFEAAATNADDDDDDAADEIIDDTNLIETHEGPEGNIEISLSDVMSSPHAAAANGSGRGYGRSQSHDEVTNENRHGYVRSQVQDLEGMGYVKSQVRDFEAGMFSNENRNGFNNSNVIMTPRSGRHAMSKLGVSPVHNHRSRNSMGNKDRYQSWDGTGCTTAGTGGLNKNYQPASPRARSFSWDRGCDDNNDNNNGDHHSNSGSTWTTTQHLDALPNLACKSNAPSRPAVAAAIATAAIGAGPTQHRGLPPKSPRFLPVTPRSGNHRASASHHHHRQQGAGKHGQPRHHPPQGHPQQQQQQTMEQREPMSSSSSRDSLSEQERQDQRLSELREELMAEGDDGGGGGGASLRSASVHQQHRPSTASSDHHHHNTASESSTIDPPMSGASVRSGPPNVVVRSDGSSSMSGGSQSDTSYATQLTQKLQAMAEAELLQGKERTDVEGCKDGETKMEEEERTRTKEAEARRLKEERDRELERAEEKERREKELE